MSAQKVSRGIDIVRFLPARSYLGPWNEPPGTPIIWPKEG